MSSVVRLLLPLAIARWLSLLVHVLVDYCGVKVNDNDVLMLIFTRFSHYRTYSESKDEWLCDDVRACYPSEDAPPITTPSTNFSLKEFLDNSSSSTHAQTGDYSRYNYTTNKVDANAGRLVVKDDDFSRRRVLIDDMDVVRVSVANVTPNGSTLKVEYPRVQSMNLQPYLPKAECGTVKLKQGQIAYVKLGYPLDAKKKRLGTGGGGRNCTIIYPQWRRSASDQLLQATALMTHNSFIMAQVS